MYFSSTLEFFLNNLLGLPSAAACLYLSCPFFFLHCLRVTTAHVQREGGDLPQRVDGARVSAGAGGERGSL